MTVDNDKSVTHEGVWRGPLKNRNCTDLPCLLIFIIFLICWFGVGYYALFVGDINKFLVPIDSKGRKCGVDDGVVDKPVLVFFDLTKCIQNQCNTPQVCRSECPQKNWYFQPNPQSINETYNSMLCEDGIDVMNKNITELEKLIKSSACAKWYLSSTSILKRCIPKSIPSSFENITMTIKELKKAVIAIKLLTSVQRIINEAIGAKNPIFLFIFGCMLICLIYIILLRWIALPCILITTISIIALLAFSSYYFYLLYDSNMWTGWIVLTSILGGLAIIITLVVICLWNRIYLACQLITETSKATTDILSILFFPIFPWLIHLSVIIYSIIIALYLMSIEYRKFIVKEELENGNCQCSKEVNYTVGNLCEPDIFYKYCHEYNGSCFSLSCHLNNISTPLYKYYMYAIHIVGFLWLYCFIFDLKRIIIASTYATWYWTLYKANIPFFTIITSFCRVVKYHLGTIAFGSAIITLCRLFRIFFEYLHAASRQQLGSDSSIMNNFYCCTKCMMMVLEKILKFLTGNAYIMCAINGKNLCAAAADALSLLMTNILRTGVLNRIVSWLLRLGKILITCVMILLSWWYFKQNQYDDSHEYWYVPIILIGLASYLIANVFFSVYAVGVDTIFLCVLQDCEYNDGSREKPYYMSRKIGKLFDIY